MAADDPAANRPGGRGVERPCDSRVQRELAIPTALIGAPERTPAPSSAELGLCLVTGAEGYAARALAHGLLEHGERVRALGACPPALAHERLDWITGDVRDHDTLGKACEGIDTAFHTVFAGAAIAFEPRPRRASQPSELACVRRVLDACRGAGVSRLVYTSAPFASQDRAFDLVLEAGRAGELSGCVLQPGLVYGPGPGGGLERLVKACAAGSWHWHAGIGAIAGAGKVGLVCVDNLIEAQIGVARQLVDGSGVCGRTIRIEDGAPRSAADLAVPLLRGLGVVEPTWRLPGRIAELAHAIGAGMRRRLGLEPAAFEQCEAASERDLAALGFGGGTLVDSVESERRALAYCRDALAQLEREEQAARAARRRVQLPLPIFPNIRWCLNSVSRVHRALYLGSGGLLGHTAGEATFLLLHHAGRRTGQARVTPLLYVGDGQRCIVAATNAGDERLPAWWLNLCDTPDTQVQIGNRLVPVRARRAGPEECDELWSKLIGAYRHFTRYRANVAREIPLVLLERR